MLRWHVIFLTVTLISAGDLRAGQVPFTQDGIASLNGRNICGLEGEFPKSMGVSLDRQNQHALESRERDGILAVFLVSEQSGRNCGIVDAAMNLTPMIKPGETLEFKCYAGSEGGTTWGRWGHIIGLADNRGGKKRFVKARVAWRVNVTKRRFEKLTGRTVKCDTSGYEN